MPATTARGEKTRRLIIERASVVFEERGFVAASLNHLVAATGLTRGAFYFHFESKEAVAHAIVQRQAERWAPIMRDVKGQETEPIRMVRLAFAAADALQRDPLIRAGHRLMTERAIVLREVPAPFTWWVETMRRYLAEADSRGQLPDLTPLAGPSSTDPPDVARRSHRPLGRHPAGRHDESTERSVRAGIHGLGGAAPG